MFNASELRAEIARSGLKYKDVAKSIGVTATTFSKKMRDGSFGITEAGIMIRLLGIQNPDAIFFGVEYPEKIPEKAADEANTP